MMEEELGTFYTVWQDDESSIVLDPECAPLIDRAMKLWADSGHTRDTWVSVCGPTGAEYGLLASHITAAMTSTPQQRAAATMRDKAIEEERAEMRRAAGYIESE